MLRFPLFCVFMLSIFVFLSYQPEINKYSSRADLEERGRGRERGRDRREKYRDQEDGMLSSTTSLHSQVPRRPSTGIVHHASISSGHLGSKYQQQQKTLNDMSLWLPFRVQTITQGSVNLQKREFFLNTPKCRYGPPLWVSLYCCYCYKGFF